MALRRVIERYELPVIITANQNIILTEIEPSWKSDILNTLHGAGVRYACSPHQPARGLINSCCRGGWCHAPESRLHERSLLCVMNICKPASARVGTECHIQPQNMLLTC